VVAFRIASMASPKVVSRVSVARLAFAVGGAAAARTAAGPPAQSSTAVVRSRHVVLNVVSMSFLPPKTHLASPFVPPTGRRRKVGVSPCRKNALRPLNTPSVAGYYGGMTCGSKPTRTETPTIRRTEPATSQRACGNPSCMPAASHAASAPAARRLAVWAVAVLCALVLLATSCRKQAEQPEQANTVASDRYAVPEWKSVPPPDLSRCTRLEVKYSPSTLWAVAALQWEQALLDPLEKEFLESLKPPLVVEDAERIRAFAESVLQTSYKGQYDGGVGTRPVTYVVCYRGGHRVESISVGGPDICTGKGQLFTIRSRRGFLYLTPQTAPFEFRVNCARNLSKMSNGMHRLVDSGQGYPSPDEWCDVLVRHERLRRHIGTYPVPWLTCPSAGEGHSHYAMNPNCGADSAGEMVLLFETKAGWNQHGGPELFTFDHHDPKGGCVLLNDGTVKFIRTEEELHALRWR